MQTGLIRPPPPNAANLPELLPLGMRAHPWRDALAERIATLLVDEVPKLARLPGGLSLPFAMRVLRLVQDALDEQIAASRGVKP